MQKQNIPWDAITVMDLARMLGETREKIDYEIERGRIPAPQHVFIKRSYYLREEAEKIRDRWFYAFGTPEQRKVSGQKSTSRRV